MALVTFYARPKAKSTSKRAVKARRKAAKQPRYKSGPKKGQFKKK